MSKLNNFSAQYRVYYEDTDAGGVVYYANYLKFFERARTDFLRALEISQQKLMVEEKIAFVVRNCRIDYIIPARLDDLIDVSVKVVEVGGASIVMAQEISGQGQLLAALQVEIVTVGAEGFRPKRIPSEIRARLM